MKKYIKTIEIVAMGKINEGVLYLIPELAVEIMYLLISILFWKSVFLQENNVGINVFQMVSYTFISVALKEILSIETKASSWNYEGIFNSLFTKPMNVLLNLSIQAIGDKLPRLLIFTLPMFIIAPFCGINIIPVSLWVIPSFILTVSLGFAIDYLFACLTIRLMGMSWLVYSIRMAIISILSGAVIPIAILPFGLDKILLYQPFASLGGAFLSIYTGIKLPEEIIPMQIFWNVVLWPLAIIIFKKSREIIVSYGG